jgi:hypothetical protein
LYPARYDFGIITALKVEDPEQIGTGESAAHADKPFSARTHVINVQ